MSETASTGWVATRFSCSKEQMQKIYEALEYNNFDIVKAFDVVCDLKTFQDLTIESAPMLLHRIQTVKALIVVHGRNFERLYQAWLDSIKWMHCEVVHLDKK